LLGSDHRRRVRLGRRQSPALQARPDAGCARRHRSRRRARHSPARDAAGGRKSAAALHRRKEEEMGMNIPVMILGMALINLVIRWPVYLFANHFRFPPLIERALAFVPVAVLTAIIVPTVLYPDGRTLDA